MLSHDDRSRLRQIESMLRADDPILDRALEQGRPRAPREYRRARWHTLAYVALTAIVLAVSVATSRWPAVSAGCVLAAIALSLAAAVAGTGACRDRPVPDRRRRRADP
jgi:uncharacterized membrane protein YdbT with pleckstrin-like domain